MIFDTFLNQVNCKGYAAQGNSIGIIPILLAMNGL